ncbi:MAG: HD domain-containing protein [Candidatus Omnitrophica bacterium]|nr:HD domain-containing protein [Candidatus Omnitrophota bacterium]
MRAAVLDIGSNSIKLVIGEKSGDDIKILESLKNVVPIGRNTFFRGRIAQETINQTISLFEKYQQCLKEYDVKEVVVIATTAVREAANRDMFVDTVMRKTGLKVEVLNVGDVVYYIDAYLSYKLKKKYPIHEKNLLIVELGAGSVDISVLEKGFTQMSVGIPVGTLRLKNFMNSLDGTLQEIYEAVEEYIVNEIHYVKKSIPHLKIDDVIVVDENYSGYLNNFVPSRSRQSEFFQFRIKESEDLLAKLTESYPETVAVSYKVPADVVETMTGYAIIVNKIFRLTKNKYIYILDTSLAEAVLANMIFKLELFQENNKTNQLISVAQNLCGKYKMDLNHCRHVAELSKSLFDQLQGTLGLKKEDLICLTLAAYLHDIGMFVNNRTHHKHSEYIIGSLNLFRLTEEEMNMIACIARYHRKGAPSRAHLLYNSLSSEHQILVQKLSALLRMANALDRSHKQKIKRIEVVFNPKGDVNIIAQASGNLLLEKAFFKDKKELFEEITGNRVTLTLKSRELPEKANDTQ